MLWIAAYFIFGDPDVVDWGIFECDNCGHQVEEQVVMDDWPCEQCGEGIMRLL